MQRCGVADKSQLHHRQRRFRHSISFDMQNNISWDYRSEATANITQRTWRESQPTEIPTHQQHMAQPRDHYWYNAGIGHSRWGFWTSESAFREVLLARALLRYGEYPTGGLRRAVGGWTRAAGNIIVMCAGGRRCSGVGVHTHCTVLCGRAGCIPLYACPAARTANGRGGVLEPSGVACFTSPGWQEASVQSAHLSNIVSPRTHERAATITLRHPFSGARDTSSHELGRWPRTRIAVLVRGQRASHPTISESYVSWESNTLHVGSKCTRTCGRHAESNCPWGGEGAAGWRWEHLVRLGDGVRNRVREVLVGREHGSRLHAHWRVSRYPEQCIDSVNAGS